MPVRRPVSIHILLGLALLLLAPIVPGDSSAWSQDREAVGGIEGTVTDEEGHPLNGVLVELDGTGSSAVTDEAGHFSFRRVPAGRYTLRFRVLGHAVRTDRVRVEPGGRVRLDVALRLEAVAVAPIDVMLERVRLVGRELRGIPGAAHVLDSEELRSAGLAFDDVHQMLRRVPGMHLQEEEGYGLRPNIGIRGTGSERSSKITVMEDGVLAAPAPYAAPAAYYFPLAGRMDALEVRKGSSQIKYGPRTTGGALNLVSAPIPDTFRVEGEVEGGEDATRKLRALAGDSYRNFGWLAQAYRIRTDGFKRLDGGGDTGFDVEDYLVKLRVNTNRDARVYQSLELKLGYTDEVSDETYLGLTEADFRQDPFRRYAASREDVMEAEHRQIQLRHFLRPSSSVDVTTTLYHNDFARNWYKLDGVLGTKIADVLDRPEEHADALSVIRGENGDADALVVRANNREYFSRGVETVLALDLGDLPVGQLELGIRYHEDQEDRFQHEDGFRMDGGRMIQTSRGAPGSQDNRVSDARAWAFFLQDRIDAGSWTVTPGLRYERIRFTRSDYATDDPGRADPTRVRENGVEVLIPGIGVSRRLSSAVSLFSGVHRGFGPPGPGAEEETRAEESWNYELGARLATRRLKLEAAGFVHDYRNVLGRATLATGEGGSGDLFNGGAVDVQGVELSAGYAPHVGVAGGLELPLSLSYTWTRARFRTSFESDFGPWDTVEAGDELPYLPAHQLFASAGLRHPRGSANLSASFSDRMRTVAGSGPIPDGQGTDSFLVLNASADYAVAPWGRVFVGVQNLTGENYLVARRPAGARPGMDRTIVAGLRVAR